MLQCSDLREITVIVVEGKEGGGEPQDMTASAALLPDHLYGVQRKSICLQILTMLEKALGCFPFTGRSHHQDLRHLDNCHQTNSS